MAFKVGSIYADATLDTKKWTTGLKSMSKGVTAALSIIGTAFIGAMALNIKKADEWQKSMSNVSTVIDTTAISTSELTKELLQLDPALGGTTELTNGLYQSFSAGASTAEEALQTTVDSAKFAKAAVTDTSTAVDLLTTAVNAYGKENINTTQASDIFFKTIEKGKITGEQLATSIGQSIPLFASSKLELTELAAGMAAMTKQGVASSEATTQLNAIVNSFLQPSEQLAGNIKALGHESGAAFLETEGLSGALKFMEQATGGDAAKIAELVPNLRAMRGVMALTGVGGKEFARTLEEMENSVGATDVAFRKQEKTFDTLKNQLGKVQIITGNIGKHFIDEIANGATEATGEMIKFIVSSEGMNLIGDIAGYASAGFGALKESVKPIAETLGPALQGIWSQLQSTFSKANEKTEEGVNIWSVFGGALKTVSIGITIVGKTIEGNIQLIENLVVAIYRSGKVVGSFFDALKGKVEWSEVKENAGAVKDAFVDMVTGVGGTVSDIIDTVVEEFSTLGEESLAVGNRIESSITLSFTKTKNKVTSNWDEMVTGQKSATEQMLEDFNNMSLGITKASDDTTEGIENNTDYLKQISEAATSEEMALVDNLLNRKQYSYSQMNDMIKLAYEKTFITEEEYAEASKELWKRNFEEKIDIVNKFVNSVFQIFSYLTSTIGTLLSEDNKAVTSEIENAARAKLETLEDLHAKSAEKILSLKEEETITEEEYNERIKALDEKLKDDKAKIEEEKTALLNTENKKRFESEKLLRKANVWIAAGQSIMGWWAEAPSLGPIAGPIFAGVMTAVTIGAALKQIASIDEQQFIPAKEGGGRASGLTRINEKGGEIVNLPDGSLVIPNDISKQIAVNTDNANTENKTYFEEKFIFNITDNNFRNEQDIEYLVAIIEKRLGRIFRNRG